uniref:Uncharacterized protein n=1 Tax=Arundo donax TaxID=35708 RepID=A0A0A9F599_ARUDO
MDSKIYTASNRNQMQLKPSNPIHRSILTRMKKRKKLGPSSSLPTRMQPFHT